MKKWYLYWKIQNRVQGFIVGDNEKPVSYANESEAYESMVGHMLENVCEAIEL